MPMAAKGLAKLVEECGELTQVAGKKLAYFSINEHPDGAGLLDQRMIEEMGDVIAAINFTAKKFGLDPNAIAQRARMKTRIFHEWDDDMSNNEYGVDHG